MSGSIQARPTPSCWKNGPICTGRPMSISRARTSIAAGSIPRCSNPAARGGRAPYDTVITHGFTMAEDGRKMSKSLGNQVFPQDVIKQSGADILRLWVASTDYVDDQRIGPEILKSNVEAYRKLRNTLALYTGRARRLEDESGASAAQGYAGARALCSAQARRAPCERAARLSRPMISSASLRALLNFMNVDLSAFYLDIRKDSLYCDRAVIAAPARLPHCDGSALPLPHDLARAHPVLHGGRSLAVAVQRAREARSI